MKSKKLLDSFTKYCKDNPNQRFWQALTNWSDFHIIYGQRIGGDYKEIEDTFYMEGKS